MLVLARTRDEWIEIDVPPSDVSRKIKVVICDIRHGKNVRLGFDADRDIKVLRAEIVEKTS